VLNQSAIFPSYRVNLGASGGFSPQKYLFADAETSLLTDTSKLFGTASFGLSAMSLNSNTGLTVEALARYDYGVTPQSTTASWCVPAGDVAGADGATAPAETCKDRALGKPTQDHTIRGEVYAGWTDASVGRWRTSGGVRVDLNLGPDTTASTTASLRLPTTVDLAAVERRNTADKLTYDGLIRFTPFVDLVFSDGQTTPKVGVELALLGRRSLFSSAFDSL
jgi:hypothetical protein